MPIERKVFSTGSSKAITLPASWLKYYEKKYKRKIKSILMETDRKIEIFVKEEFEKKNKKGEA